MEGTFIKIDRKIIKWQWFSDPVMLQVFMYLLVKANIEDRKWEGVIIRRGQLVSGRLKLALALNLSEMKIRTCLNRLKSTNEITIQTTNRYSIITICKYDDYQQNKKKNNQRNNQRTNQQTTNKQPTNNQQITTTKEYIKNDKNDKNVKNSIAELKNENVSKENKEDFQLNKIYVGGFKNAEKIFKGLSEKGFLQWIDFIDFVYKNGYSEIFRYRCINPLDFEKINFPKKDWDEVIKAILGTGIKEEHNLRWRIPQFLAYLKNKKSDKSKGFHEVPENIDYDNLSMR